MNEPKFAPSAIVIREEVVDIGGVSVLFGEIAGIARLEWQERYVTAQGMFLLLKNGNQIRIPDPLADEVAAWWKSRVWVSASFEVENKGAENG